MRFHVLTLFPQSFPGPLGDSMVGMGFPQFMADTFGELFVNFANNGADRTTGDVEKVTGHPARSIDEFARDFATMFSG